MSTTTTTIVQKPANTIKQIQPALRILPIPAMKMRAAIYIANGDEIGGMLEFDIEDPLLVTDVHILKQEVTKASVEFCDEALADYMEKMAIDRKLPDRCYRTGWWHHHPFNSSHPSGTDETTFREKWGDLPWSLMFITSEATHYCRLRVNVANQVISQQEIPIHWLWHCIDYVPGYENYMDSIKELTKGRVNGNGSSGNTFFQSQHGSGYLTYRGGLQNQAGTANGSQSSQGSGQGSQNGSSSSDHASTTPQSLLPSHIKGQPNGGVSLYNWDDLTEAEWAAIKTNGLSVHPDVIKDASLRPDIKKIANNLRALRHGLTSPLLGGDIFVLACHIILCPSADKGRCSYLWAVFTSLDTADQENVHRCMRKIDPNVFHPRCWMAPHPGSAVKHWDQPTSTPPPVTSLVPPATTIFAPNDSYDDTSPLSLVPETIDLDPADQDVLTQLIAESDARLSLEEEADRLGVTPERTT